MSDTSDNSGTSNPYQSPASELSVAQGAVGGSIEQTLAGNAQLDFGETLSEAWAKTKGIKTILIGGMAVMMIGVIVVSGVLGFALGIGESSIVSVLVQLVIMAVVYPFMAGTIMVCIRQSVGLPVSFNQLFGYYSKTLTILGLAIVISIVVTIGFLLFILPGLYLSFATVLAIPLHVEKNLGIIDSLMTSIKIVNKEFFTVLGLLLVTTFALMLAGITVIGLIGYIWLVPWTAMVMAVIYRQLAGVEQAA